MPGLITHYICGEATYKMLDPEIQQIIKNNRQLYNIGTQGPDIFFYYIPGFFNKHLKDIGTKMHKNSFSTFIGLLIDSIGELDEESKNAGISYLFGYLTHYVLDYQTHPYIYYKSGFRKKEEPIKSAKYSVYHKSFETAIDVLMLKMVSSQTPSEYKLWQLVKTNYKDAVNVAESLSKSISTAYNTKCTKQHVYGAMKYMSLLTRILQSGKGKKKKLMQFVEDLTIGENLISSLIHAQNINDGIDYLNIKEGSWRLPWDDKIEYTDSFAHLYNKSIGIATDLIKSTKDFFCGIITREDLIDILGNNSLATGIDCGDEVIFKFSEVVYE